MYDPNLHLLADNDELTHHWNLTRTIGRPDRATRPLLQADRPWEGEQIACWGTVIHDPADGLFKIWYQTWLEDVPAAHVSRSVICYAQSRDGLTWEKPNLGVTMYHGSTDHNVVYTVEDFDQPHQLDCFAVLHEPEDPHPARRFKMLAWLRAIAIGVGGEEILETSLILSAGAAGRRLVRRTDPQHRRYAYRAVRPVGSGWLD